MLAAGLEVFQECYAALQGIARHVMRASRQGKTWVQYYKHYTAWPLAGVWHCSQLGKGLVCLDVRKIDRTYSVGLCTGLVHGAYSMGVYSAAIGCCAVYSQGLCMGDSFYSAWL